MLDAEIWLAERMRKHGIAVSRLLFEGISDQAERCKRFRKLLLEEHLAGVVAGTNSQGKSETYSQVFERLYGEPLESKSSKSRKKDQRP